MQRQTTVRKNQQSVKKYSPIKGNTFLRIILHASVSYFFTAADVAAVIEDTVFEAPFPVSFPSDAVRRYL